MHAWDRRRPAAHAITQAWRQLEQALAWLAPGAWRGVKEVRVCTSDCDAAGARVVGTLCGDNELVRGLSAAALAQLVRASPALEALPAGITLATTAAALERAHPWAPSLRELSLTLDAAAHDGGMPADVVRADGGALGALAGLRRLSVGAEDALPTHVVSEVAQTLCAALPRLTALTALSLSLYVSEGEGDWNEVTPFSGVGEVLAACPLSLLELDTLITLGFMRGGAPLESVTRLELRWG